MDIRKVLLSERGIHIGNNNVVTGAGFRSPGRDGRLFYSQTR